MSEGRGQDPGQYILQVVATLALDTSTPGGSVAVRRDGVVLYARAGDGSRPHGMRLPGDALDALEACRLTLGDVTLLAVGLGPGPFTGLRVGLATIEGLAFATGLPVVGVSGLDALAVAAARVFIGSGAILYGQDVVAAMPCLHLIDAPLVAPLVAELGELRAARDGATPLNALRPLYVRRPDAELARRRAAAPRVS